MNICLLPNYKFLPLKGTPFTVLKEASKKFQKVGNTSLKKKKEMTVCSHFASLENN